MPVYIAKPDTWFKEGTIAELEEYLFIDGNSCKHGLFRGTYVVGPNEGYDTYWHKQGYKEGDEVQMTELCAYEEFEKRDV
jgi:hypothetical protein